MHLHILGICGTFMGGIAAIAQGRRPPRHRLRRQRLSADEHAARARSASTLTEGYDAGAARRRRADADVFVVGNVVVARQPADGGDPRRAACRTCPGPQWLCENVLRGQLGARGRRARTARRRRRRCSRGSSSTRASSPGFLIGGVPLDFGVSARLTDSAVLRHRGRRVRHRVLRQALEVRPLPAAHGDPQQPRVRPRRHLPRPRGDRDAVPPPACARCRGSGRLVVNGGEASLARVLARGCWSEVERFGLAEVPRAPAPSGRSPSTARSCSAARRRARCALRTCRARTTS